MIVPTNTSLWGNLTTCSFHNRFDMTETVILKCASWLLQGIRVDEQIHLFLHFSFHSRFPARNCSSTKVRNGLYFGSLFRRNIPLRSISSIPLCPGALSKCEIHQHCSLRQGLCFHIELRENFLKFLSSFKLELPDNAKGLPWKLRNRL